MSSMLLHTHSAAWLIMVILFILSIAFKKQKVTPMILRLFYLIILGTGIGMLINLSFPLTYVLKGILAVVLIGLMEMILGRTKRGEGSKMPVPAFWVIWVVLLIVIVLTGFGVISL